MREGPKISSDYPRPSAFWVGLAAWLMVLVPVIAMEWCREPARWHGAAAEEMALEGRFSEALKRINRAVLMDPKSPRLRLQRVSILQEMARQDRPWRRLGDDPGPGADQRKRLLQQALKDVTELIDEGGLHRFGVRELRIELRMALGDGEGAVKDWEAVRKVPTGISPLNLLNGIAYTRACAGLELEQALKDSEESMEFSPDGDSAILDTRGFIHYLLGNREAAIEDLNRAVDLHRKEYWNPWNEGPVTTDRGEETGMSGREIAMRSDVSDVRIVNQVDLHLREGFAVILYHRSLALKESDPELAEQDQQEIRDLLPGYDGRPMR